MSVTGHTLKQYSEQAQTLWAAALALNRAAATVSLPPLLFFTDPVRTPQPWRTAEHMPVGSAVVFRHFGAPDAEVTARRLREVTTERGVKLLIGLDVDLAEGVGADGLHLPDRARSQAADIRARHQDWIITAAAHADRLEVDRGVMGLDALILSPVFETASPSQPRPPLGVEGLTEVVRRLPCPVYGLGGINSTNVGQLSATGLCGIAGVEGFSRVFAL